MEKLTIKQLRNLDITTKLQAQGTKRRFHPIIVKRGQAVNGVVLAHDTAYETSNKAVKLDAPTLIAMQYLADKWPEGIEESTVMRWALSLLAYHWECDDPIVQEEADAFRALWIR